MHSSPTRSSRCQVATGEVAWVPTQTASKVPHGGGESISFMYHWSYSWQIEKLESWHWGLVTDSQKVTWTAFSILAKISILFYFAIVSWQSGLRTDPDRVRKRRHKIVAQGWKRQAALVTNSEVDNKRRIGNKLQRYTNLSSRGVAQATACNYLFSIE